MCAVEAAIRQQVAEFKAGRDNSSVKPARAYADLNLRREVKSIFQQAKYKGRR